MCCFWNFDDVNHGEIELCCNSKFCSQDLAFTLAEREKLGLKGLLPPAVRSQSLQADAIMANLRHFKEGINKYMYLRDLQDWNKKLFYRILCDHTEEVMPIVYTPIVGEACQKYRCVFDILVILSLLFISYSIPIFYLLFYHIFH